MGGQEQRSPRQRPSACHVPLMPALQQPCPSRTTSCCCKGRQAALGLRVAAHSWLPPLSWPIQTSQVTGSRCRGRPLLWHPALAPDPFPRHLQWACTLCNQHSMRAAPAAVMPGQQPMTPQLPLPAAAQLPQQPQQPPCTCSRPSAPRAPRSTTPVLQPPCLYCCQTTSRRPRARAHMQLLSCSTPPLGPSRPGLTVRAGCHACMMLA